MPIKGQKPDRERYSMRSLISAILPVAAVSLAIAIFWSQLTAFLLHAAEGMRPDAAVLLLGATTMALVTVALRQRRSTSIIRREVENREKQIRFHQGQNQEIRESEQRYKTLFEDAMRAGYLDLEKLNQTLNEKQVKLADEIAKHKETESALKESELRWMKLVEKNPDAIIITVGDNIAYVNPAGMQILGADSLDDLRGVPLIRFLPDDLKDTVSQQISSGTDADAQGPLEFDIVGCNGTNRTVELHAVPAVFRRQQAAQCVLRDVTERKQSELALRLYTERLQTMVEIERMTLLSEPIDSIASETLKKLRDVIHFEKGIVIEFNQLTGHVGELASIGISEPDKLLAASPFRRTKWQWSTLVGSDHVEVVRGDSEIDEWVRIQGMKSYLCIPLAAKDEVLGLIVFMSDAPVSFNGDAIGMSREFADLLALAINQERIVEERKNYEMEILSAKEHAEELVRLKSAFLTNMSHEIRTPLTSIIGFAQILSEEIDDRHSEFIDLIEQSGRRLLETINSVLDLARLESKTVIMAPEPVDLAKMIDESIVLLQPLAIKRGIKLNASGTDAPVRAEADKSAVDRILNNLIGNAIKFTDHGGVEVLLSSDETNARIEVRDTGIGISDKFLPFIFDDFKQESHGPSRTHEGSGMGLSITRKLVDVMAGTISVSSTKAHGSSFVVTLPLRSTADRETQSLRTLRGEAMLEDMSPRKPVRNVSESDIPMPKPTDTLRYPGRL